MSIILKSFEETSALNLTGKMVMSAPMDYPRGHKGIERKTEGNSCSECGAFFNSPEEKERHVTEVHGSK